MITIVLTVKHRGGSVMLCGCMISKGALRIFTNGTGNTYSYTRINAEKITSSLQKLSKGEIFQHVNDPKRTAKITQEFSKEEKMFPD